MKNKTNKGSIFIYIAIGLAIGLIFEAGTWFLSSMPANKSALETVKGNSVVTVFDKEGMITYVPKEKNNYGVIIYPGAKVVPEAYGRIALGLAEQGYITAIVRMPFNFAIFNTNAAEKVIKNNPDIPKWVIAGHSLGGVSAADFAVSHQEKIAGLIFLASYPSKDISKVKMNTLALSGEKDGLATQEKVNSKKPLYPEETIFFEIKGGNHAGFGDYGEQKGDNKADISVDEQQKIIIEKIAGFIKEI